MSNRSLLRQVIHREIRTHFTVSEMLECGHRFESLSLLADPLTAKHRACPKCAEHAGTESLPPKKPSVSAPGVTCEAHARAVDRTSIKNSLARR